MARPPTRPTIETELGEEIRCSNCAEFWPADREFFFFSNGSPVYICKACYGVHPAIAKRTSTKPEDAQRWYQRPNGLLPRPEPAP